MHSFTFAVVVFLLVTRVVADRTNHIYTSGDLINVYTSKAAPADAQFETYDPLENLICPLLKVDYPLSLGQLLTGEQFYDFQTAIRFNVNERNRTLCNYKATRNDISRIQELVKRNYSYELIFDEMPFWGFLGIVDPESGKGAVFLDHIFHIGINKNRIVSVSLETKNPVIIVADTVYSFRYSAVFNESSIEYEDRLFSLHNTSRTITRNKIFASLNSILIIFFLVAVVAVIVTRSLRSDYSKMEKELQLRYEGQDTLVESGWRCLHADVFRVPRSPKLFCAALGCGAHLLFLAVMIAIAPSLGYTFVSARQRNVSYLMMGYMFSSGISGYVSGYIFMSYSALLPSVASGWISTFHLTFIFAPMVFLVIIAPFVLTAIIYGSSQVPYFRGILILFLLFVFVSYPLSLGGSLLGRFIHRRTEKRRKIPHVNQIPRLVPRPPQFYLSPRFLLFVAGFLPFITIFVEVFTLFNFVWAQNFFYLSTFSALTFVLYIVVTACSSISATLVLLSTENHYWKWMSLGFGASCSLFVFLYVIYFYLFRLRMHGLFTFILYFSYCGVGTCFLAFVGSAVGYFASSLFVHKIFMQIKHD